MKTNHGPIIAAVLILTAAGRPPASAAETGRVIGSDQGLFEQSIRAQKQSIDREMLDALYTDAVEYYRENRLDESLSLLDKIYSINPNYQNVQSLRKTIQRMKATSDFRNNRQIIDDHMRKGNRALDRGQNVQAISFWKQALAVDPNYEPARKKIRQVNQAMAQKQFEAGYIHYHHGDLEDALDAWANAIALDPSLKQRGLLVLMSKVELSVQRDRVSKLAAQAFEQYQQGDPAAALQSYQEVLALQPRHEEARRMAAKIKIQLGQAAFRSAREAADQNRYAEAIEGWKQCIGYGYEVQKSSQSIAELERRLKELRIAASKPKPKTKPKPAAPAASTAPATPPPPPAPSDPAGAMSHYRKGLAAIRAKDYHLAMQELDIAAELDPTNERIYIARERARQEWASTNSGGGANLP